MGNEITKTTKLAIERPKNLNRTFNDHGLGVPKYGGILFDARNGRVVGTF